MLEGTVIFGVVLGGDPDKEVEKLWTFARYTGFLFYVIDDILDITKSSKELGKMMRWTWWSIRLCTLS